MTSQRPRFDGSNCEPAGEREQVPSNNDNHVDLQMYRPVSLKTLFQRRKGADLKLGCGCRLFEAFTPSLPPTFKFCVAADKERAPKNATFLEAIPGRSDHLPRIYHDVHALQCGVHTPGRIIAKRQLLSLNDRDCDQMVSTHIQARQKGNTDRYPRQQARGSAQLVEAGA